MVLYIDNFLCHCFTGLEALHSLPSVDDALWVRVRCNRTGSRSLTPVNTSVGLIEATDIDSEPLYYRLEPVTDTYNISESGEPSFTAVVTITVNVKDIDNRPPWFQPCVRTNLGTAKLCVSSGYRAKVNLTEKEVRNEGSIFQIDEETGNISMVKAADIAGPITLTVLVTNRDQFAVTQVNIEVLKKSRNPPRFEKERYEGYIYSNSVPESMILRDRTSNQTLQGQGQRRGLCHCKCQRINGVNPDMRYEVQYSSYVNVTTEGFVLLKRVVKTESFALQRVVKTESFALQRVVKTESFALQRVVKTESFALQRVVKTESFALQRVVKTESFALQRVVKTESFALQIRAMDVSTGEFGTAALSVLVIPAVAVPSPSGAGYRAGDMALLGLVMAAILVLCFICLVPCLKMARPPGRPKDSLQYTNDGYQGTEGDALRGGPRLPAPVDKRGRGATVPGDRGRAIPLERRRSDRHCGFCGLYANHNHHAKPSPASSPARGGGRGGGGDKDGMRSILAKGGRKEGGKSVWFKENEDASGIEVEIIPDTLGQEEETEEEEEEEEEEVDMEEVKGGDRSMSSQTEVDGGMETRRARESLIQLVKRRRVERRGYMGYIL
ncbi:unnamed protein product [Coregonus sp. 'balchen']|nr:unnamed protein product [Coregonus sp. 'balchen']